MIIYFNQQTLISFNWTEVLLYFCYFFCRIIVLISILELISSIDIVCYQKWTHYQVTSYLNAQFSLLISLLVYSMRLNSKVNWSMLSTEHFWLLGSLYIQIVIQRLILIDKIVLWDKFYQTWSFLFAADLLSNLPDQSLNIAKLKTKLQITNQV